MRKSQQNHQSSSIFLGLRSIHQPVSGLLVMFGFVYLSVILLGQPQAWVVGRPLICIPPVSQIPTAPWCPLHPLQYKSQHPLQLRKNRPEYYMTTTRQIVLSCHYWPMRYDCVLDKFLVWVISSWQSEWAGERTFIWERVMADNLERKNLRNRLRQTIFSIMWKRTFKYFSDTFLE